MIKKANPGQLRLVFNTLADYLPNFFNKPHCFHIYTQDVIFEDNIRNIKTTGLIAYKHNASLFRMYSHVKFHKLKMNVLKMTEHPEESCVKVRWRVVGSPNWALLVQLFYSDPKTKENVKDLVWLDGFSVFYVNDEGKICRHICDKLMPDDHFERDHKTKTFLGALGGKAGTTYATPRRPQTVC